MSFAGKSRHKFAKSIFKSQSWLVSLVNHPNVPEQLDHSVAPQRLFDLLPSICQRSFIRWTGTLQQLGFEDIRRS